MRRVLITGATGFVGRQALERFNGKGFEVHCVTTRKADDNAGDVVWHRADMLNEKDVSDLFEKVRPSHLLHFAWYAEPGKYWTSDKNLDWVGASLNMLKCFGRCGGKRATFAGTCAEYDWSSGLCSEGITPLKPKTLYGASKDGLRQVAGAYCGQNGISFSWGRIFFLYGPNEHPSRLVSSVIVSLLKGEEAKCTHGKQIRDFMYSGDVGSAFVSLLESDAEGAVNIASGAPVTVGEIVNTIALKIGRPDLVRLGAIPAPMDEPPMILADTRRLNGEVGWRPKYGLDEGLDRTIEWWKDRMENL